MKVHISFLDENNETITGWFEIIEQNNSFVKFKTISNTLTIPMHRILKIKEKEVQE